MDVGETFQVLLEEGLVTHYNMEDWFACLKKEFAFLYRQEYGGDEQRGHLRPKDDSDLEGYFPDDDERALDFALAVMSAMANSVDRIEFAQDKYLYLTLGFICAEMKHGGGDWKEVLIKVISKLRESNL